MVATIAGAKKSIPAVVHQCKRRNITVKIAVENVVTRLTAVSTDDGRAAEA